MNAALIERIVREVVMEVGRPAAPSLAEVRAARPACVRDDGWVHAVEKPRLPQEIEPLQALTSSQIAVGRSGTRFVTELYLRTREGQAVARDAVHSDIGEEWAQKNGRLALQSECKERHEYLLYPNHGRRLDEASKQRLASAERGIDVQIIVGDGLSPNAIQQNGAATLLALQKALPAAGYKIGAPLFVKFARIGVADEIGVGLSARATVMLVGERPGLGTGDSLSIYIAVNPKLEQSNAEKNCISNVRPIGIRPDEAAALTAKILQLAFSRGGGGVAIGYGFARQ